MKMEKPEWKVEQGHQNNRNSPFVRHKSVDGKKTMKLSERVGAVMGYTSCFADMPWYGFSMESSIDTASQNSNRIVL